ncbi:hypothetical protein [Vibrio coralliilyticus]|uniref:hypothetical protein n=1 Tax=Vibrio coralliilyticus TaxID=190893 RepID=UPI00185E5CE3|nr:hypothetical protein [Vibrio coralliilyticus]NUW68068.1 hypothetical protein [Vibrio coralliilyticus]
MKGMIGGVHSGVGSFRLNNSSQVNERQKSVRDESTPVRVRDVKSFNQPGKKLPKFFRVQRKDLSEHQRRQVAKNFNYQLLTILKAKSPNDINLPNIQKLNKEDIWVFQAVKLCERLYPQGTRKKIKKYLSSIDDESGELTSEIVEQLVSYEECLEGMISLLLICRKFEQEIGA